MMLPAALSILTTTFAEGNDRNTAIGAWGAVGGLSAAAGVPLGGLLTAGPGWRWVMFVNPLACALVLPGILRLISGERRRAQLLTFDLLGAVLATGGMLLLVYALVKAPTVGWGDAGTIGQLAAALALLAAFVVNELRHRNRLAPSRSSAGGAIGVALVGASMGGTASLVAGATTQPPVGAVVSLSGPANFQGMDATSAVAQLARPVLYVIARGDASVTVDEVHSPAPDHADARHASAAGDSEASGLVPMTTAAESSSELATRAISPSRMRVSAARGA
jgi:MFS family permease